MGFFDLFKKKSKEELLKEAIFSKDYVQIARLGKEFIEKKAPLSLLTPYVDALVKLGRKEEALKTLLDFAERKVREEYYEVAIPLLKKALKIDPLNLRALRLLAKSYERKKLYYEAFRTLLEAHKKLTEASLDTSQVEELIQEILKENFHPLLFEKYGELLSKSGKSDKALEYFALAGNTFFNLKDYKGALRSFLKARSLKRSVNLDKQIVEALSHLSDEKSVRVLAKVLNESLDPDFFKFTVKVMLEAKKLETLKKVAQLLSSPKFKYFLLSLIAVEEGELEEFKEYLYKLKILDENLYTAALSEAYAKYGEVPEIQEEVADLETLPDEEEVLSALEKSLTLDLPIDELEPPELREEEFLSIEEKVKELKAEGGKEISMAEAMLGIENYEKAIEYARKAVENTKHIVKAAAIVTQSYLSLGKPEEAISFLTDLLQKRKLSLEDEARIKTLLGEVYERIGEKRRALVWYREANKVLKEEELSKKIESLEK